MTPEQQLSITDRKRELEAMDESVAVKHLPRSQWPEELIKGKILLWQVPASTAKFLQIMVTLTRPKIILELGTSGGYSALCMAEAVREWSGCIHTIEFSEYRANIARETFAKTELDEMITLHVGKIAPVLDAWSEKNIDFVFIDADKPAYLENFQKIEPFLTDSAVIVCDNILDSVEKMKPFVDYMKAHKEFETNILNLDNGLLVAVKK